MGLAKTLERAKFKLKRLKTGKTSHHQHTQSIDGCDMLSDIGTPPRLDARTINTSFLQEQEGDDPPVPFSFLNEVKGIKVNGCKMCLFSWIHLVL